MRAVLVGNQNCGKSTLFNILTGSNQKIGNWPGVTVERKSGIVEQLGIELVDLPGIYSLSPYTLEEKITLGFLMNEQYDFIINVIDSTVLERSLFLTMQLLKLKCPMIIVLNRVDMLKEKEIEIDFEELERSLGVKICISSAIHGTGIKQLIKTFNEMIQANNLKKESFFKIYKEQIINDYERKICEYYNNVDLICDRCVKRKKSKNKLDYFLDKLFLNKILAIPIFALIMFSMYYFAIEIIGLYFAGGMNILLKKVYQLIFISLEKMNCYKWIIGLVCDGIIKGLGSVLSFLPSLIIIFITTSFLEASGYMARVSFIFDKIFKKIGLCGKSLIPFILGTGCSVSGIMSSKIIENNNERVRTIITNPFIPCSAKLPVITLFSSYFFDENQALIATSFYALSIIVVIFSSILFKFFSHKEGDLLYIFELPEYQFPRLSFLWKEIREKIAEFIHKIGTVIFISSIVSWIFISFSINLEYDTEINNSILATIGKRVDFITKPILGVRNWQMVIAFMQGIIAKEQIVAFIEMIGGINNLNIATYNQAYAFVAWNLFTTPCVAAIYTMRKELKNNMLFCFSILYQLLIGYFIAFIISNCV